MDATTIYKGKSLGEYTPSELRQIEAKIRDKSALRWSKTDKEILRYIESCK